MKTSFTLFISLSDILPAGGNGIWHVHKFAVTGRSGSATYSLKASAEGGPMIQSA